MRKLKLAQKNRRIASTPMGSAKEIIAQSKEYMQQIAKMRFFMDGDAIKQQSLPKENQEGFDKELQTVNTSLKDTIDALNDLIFKITSIYYEG